jgi:hypothetical protein
VNLHPESDEWINTARRAERFPGVDAKHGRRVDDAEDWTERPTRAGQAAAARRVQRTLNQLAVLVGLVAVADLAIRGFWLTRPGWPLVAAAVVLAVPAALAGLISSATTDRNRSWWFTLVALALAGAYPVLRLSLG